MIGGFLGAGKTTALLRLAAHLTAQGRRVGLITNDQSSGLVDTTLVASQGYPVEEITGGCFCCRFNSLTAAAARLSEAARPDVFLAEPVGSCTDLRASVQYPLRSLYGDDYRIAPLSVLVDPIRALRILGLEDGREFSAKVLYVYRKQLEEADLIVINKADLLDDARQARLTAALRTAYPEADVHLASARTGAGLEAWFDCLGGADAGTREAPSVDYALYAEGEALLGWFNATLRLSSATPFDGNRLLVNLVRAVGARLSGEANDLAHFKATLMPDEHLGDLGVLNQVGSDRDAELAHRLEDALSSGELIVNLRAEADPERLRGAVMDALSNIASAAAVHVEVVHLEHFRPAKPSPTYRMATVEG